MSTIKEGQKIYDGSLLENFEKQQSQIRKFVIIPVYQEFYFIIVETFPCVSLVPVQTKFEQRSNAEQMRSLGDFFLFIFK